MKDIQTFITKIVDTKFETQLNGYDTNQVDLTLDEILKKMEAISIDNQNLERLRNDVKKENEKLNNENINLKNNVKSLNQHVAEMNKTGFQNNHMVKQMENLKRDMDQIKQDKNQGNT